MMQEPIQVMKKNPFSKEQRKLAKAILMTSNELDILEGRMDNFEKKIQDNTDRIQDLCDEHYYMKKDISFKDKLKALAIALSVFVTIGISSGIIPESFSWVLSLLHF